MKPTVLIFEDSDILRSTLKYILNERGYEVFTFSNGITYSIDPVYCQIIKGYERIQYPNNHIFDDD